MLHRGLSGFAPRLERVCQYPREERCHGDEGALPTRSVPFVHHNAREDRRAKSEKALSAIYASNP